MARLQARTRYIDSMNIITGSKSRPIQRLILRRVIDEMNVAGCACMLLGVKTVGVI